MKRITVKGSKGYILDITVGTGAEIKESEFYYEGFLDQYIKLGPYGDLYILTHIDWDDIAHMADLETYDFALPQRWFDANKDKPGFRESKYVWCYDGPEYRISGHAVSLGHLCSTTVFSKILYELTKGDSE